MKKETKVTIEPVTTITPVGKRALIRRAAGVETTAGGIALGEKKPNYEGEILALGDTLPGVSVGQKVLFSRFKLPEQIAADMVVVNFDDILAVIEY
jgi:co-chaperonin GroES (HSP10)